MSWNFTNYCNRLVYLFVACFFFFGLAVNLQSQTHTDSLSVLCTTTTGGDITFDFLNAPANAIGPGTLKVYYLGDLNSPPSESITFYDENNTVIGASLATTQCGSSFGMTSFTLSAANINSMAANGTISIKGDGGTGINTICTYGTTSNVAWCGTLVLSYPIVTGPNDAGLASIDSPMNFCAGTHNVVATIKNAGTNQITSVTVNWEFNGTAQTPYSWSGTLDTTGGSGSSTAQVVLGSKAFAAGTNYTIKAWTSNPNAVADTSNINDTAQVTRQPALSGTFTIGGTTPSYATFASAIADLNTYGICGPVIFDVRPGTYTEQIDINNIMGTSAVNTVTFRAENGDSSSVNLTYSSLSSSAPHTLRLNGCSYIIFSKMTITGAGSSYARTIVIDGAASNNTFSHCRIMGNSSGSTSTYMITVYLYNNNASNNLFDQNLIRGGSYGMYLRGQSIGNGHKNNIIRNNLIEPHYMGIYMYYGEATIIEGNKIHTGTFSSYTSCYGIYAYYVDSAMQVLRNEIVHQAGIYGMYFYNCPASGANPGKIINNMVHVGGSSTAYGMYLAGSTSNYDIYHNSINITSGNTSSGRAFYLNANAGFNFNIVNNVFANNGGGYCSYITYPGAVTTMNYNNYFTTGATMGYWSTNVTTLALWQTITTKDTNSVAIDPGFFTSQNLHATSSGLNDNGTPIGVLDDIDGEVRSLTTPDMGADEFVPPPNDLMMVGFASPLAFGCDATATTQVTIIVYNNGSAAQSLFYASYRIYSLLVDTDTITQTIQPGDSLLYTFNSTVDLSTPGLYPFSGWVVLPGDQNNYNDSVFAYPVNSDTLITGFPYLVDFEVAPSIPIGWANDFYDGTEDWNFNNTGSPYSNGIPGDHTTGSGLFAWVDNSYPHNAAINLLTPCLDFSSMSNPHLEFYYWNTDINSSIILHVDVLSNGQWHEDVLGPLGYQSINSWGYQLKNLNQFGGQTVKIRFRAEETNTSSSPDVAIDDVKIFNQPPINAGVSSVLNPVSKCGMTDIEPLEVTIEHTGFDTLYPGDTIWVAFQVNGGSITNEVVVLQDTLFQFGTVNYTFASVVNMSTPGYYDLSVWTSHPLDDDFTNDTANVELVNIPVISTYPYVEDFEADAGAWVTSGTNNSWGWGTPQGAFISTAASGVNAWSTGFTTGNGVYNNNENSQVEGPCFDFSNLNKPQIALNIWWEAEWSWDGAVLQSSLDSGQTWQNVGNMNDDLHWYNDNTIYGNPGGQQIGWSGTAGNGSNGWRGAKHRLDGLGSQSSVLLRIAFASDASVNSPYTGFAFDDIVIGETPVIGLGDTIFACGFYMFDAGHANGTYKWSTGHTSQQVLILAGQTQTVQTITLELTDQWGLCNSDTVVLVLDPGPYVNLGADTLVCGDTMMTLDAGNPGMNYTWDDASTNQTRTAIGDGTYFVEVEHSNGCKHSDTIVIDFELYPIAGFTSVQDSHATILTFTDISSDAVSYYWEFGDGFFSTLQNPDHYYPAFGTYDVMLVVGNQCGFDTFNFQVTVDTVWGVGLQGYQSIHTLDMYPNPTDGQLTLQMTTTQVDDIFVTILNLQGQAVMEEKIDASSGIVKKQLDLSQLPAGIYSVRVNTGKESVIRKIVKQ